MLVGGGHAHVHVLKAFAADPVPGWPLTLVSRDPLTPYSGMLPGVIAGFYDPAEAHIDLARLCAACGARLVQGEAVALDRAAKRVRLADGTALPYDLLSLDIGITPDLTGIAGAAEHAIAVKPIGGFLAKLDALLQSCRAADGPRRIAVIGGGAGGVELLLSLRARLLREMPGRDFAFALISAGPLLAGHNARVQAAFRRILAEAAVALQEGQAAMAVSQRGIALADGTSLAADAVLIATGAAAPAWLARTGLACDPGGFVQVGPALQSVNDPAVFAAGDCAALSDPRPKAGVFAVRAGPPLAANLRRAARGEALQPWRPQRRHLALISTGARHAVASRGAWKAEGAWLWRLKDWIDRRWMRQYQL